MYKRIYCVLKQYIHHYDTLSLFSGASTALLWWGESRRCACNRKTFFSVATRRRGAKFVLFLLHCFQVASSPIFISKSIIWFAVNLRRSFMKTSKSRRYTQMQIGAAIEWRFSEGSCGAHEVAGSWIYLGFSFGEITPHTGSARDMNVRPWNDESRVTLKWLPFKFDAFVDRLTLSIVTFCI